jgi:hypothetical protein
MAHGFSLKGHFPIMEFNTRGSPMIILKSGDRQLEVYQAKRMEGKFFMTKHGIFELDAEYEYKMSNNAVYFYNIHNAKPIWLQGIETVQRFYREKKADLIVKELASIDQVVKDITNPIEAMNRVFEKSKDSKLTQEELKFLIDYRLYDGEDIDLLIIKRMDLKKVNVGMSGKVNTILPLLLFSLIGIGAVVIMRFLNPFTMLSP